MADPRAPDLPDDPQDPERGEAAPLLGRGTKAEDPPPGTASRGSAPCGFSLLGEGLHHLEPRAEDPDTDTPRHRLYLLLEDPHSSSAAWFVSASILFLVACSVVCFVLETMIEFEKHSKVWWSLECFFCLVFAVEYGLRVWCRQRTFCKFFWAPLNLMDLLAILPFFVDILLWALLQESHGWDLRVLRAARLVRIVKFGRASPKLQLITESLVASASSMLLLMYLLLTAVLFFSALIFMAERGTWSEKEGCYVRQTLSGPGGAAPAAVAGNVCSPYQSIPEAFWWTITTMTTTGYGEYFPYTFPGKLVGGFTMVVGLLTVALPTTILGLQFAENYSRIEQTSKVEKVKERLPKEDEIRGEIEWSLGRCDVIVHELDILVPEVSALLRKIASQPRAKEVERGFPMVANAAMQGTRDSLKFLKDSLNM